MSYTTGTTHYNLPLTTNNDKRDWADTNQAFSDVDAALYGAVSDTSTQGVEITALDTRLTTAEGNISTNAAGITALDTRLTTAEGNITTQANQIADVRADAEDMICAYNEPTATSTHAYAIDKYFIYNNVLYRATASIAVGDTIVPDTNCTSTNITTELLAAGSDAVDMICAITENTTTSTHNYSSGDYFILERKLYRATAAITVGTIIVPETNCTSTTTASELVDIKSDLADIAAEIGGTVIASITADGIKTYTQLLDSLHNQHAIDINKEYLFIFKASATNHSMYHCQQIDNTDNMHFTYSRITSGSLYTGEINMKNSGSTFVIVFISTTNSTVTRDDRSSSVPTSGEVYEIVELPTI